MDFIHPLSSSSSNNVSCSDTNVEQLSRFSDSAIDVVIIGAGAVGLSTAFRLSQSYSKTNVRITIIADKFVQQTTSYGSGGLWEPYAMEGTSPEDINRWGRYSFEYFRDEFLRPTAYESGVQLISTYQLLEEHDDSSPPSWSDIVYNFSPLSAQDIQKMGLPAKFTKGYSFATYVVDQRYYLQYMMRQLKAHGVSFVQRKIHDLRELSDQADIIINCSGLGSHLVAQDLNVYPIRGQVLRLRAPWIKNVWLLGSKGYIIPNMDNIVIGGTIDKNDWDTTVRLDDTKAMLDRVVEVFPSLETAQVENAWVGLRPGRAPLRLELETISLVEHTSKKTSIDVIHCYGHGGAGVTLAMGCAQDVLTKFFQPLYEARMKTDI